MSKTFVSMMNSWISGQWSVFIQHCSSVDDNTKCFTVQFAIHWLTQEFLRFISVQQFITHVSYSISTAVCSHLGLSISPKDTFGCGMWKIGIKPPIFSLPSHRRKFLSHRSAHFPGRFGFAYLFDSRIQYGGKTKYNSSASGKELYCICFK